MTPADRLHPALLHHIVNTLGWPALRPFQQAAIDPILDGTHSLLIAPTAGGKTEAAFFPILSRMLTEEWPALSVIYVCPIKALLNNLHHRLQHYAQLVGRSVELWHGDVAGYRRSKLLKDPPDVLLTTPESLEVVLISRRAQGVRFLETVRALVVDEIHAFAGDDRGWHLLAVLDRITKAAGREIQRIGLSATVGNPDQLLDWLAGTCHGPRQVVTPGLTQAAPADVTLDHVGGLDNAATLISRLHRGEKRLVFVDSRSGAEKLANKLRVNGTTTFVSHSSLSLSERRRAEEAFSQGTNCVIVATSTLELGVDVGDLDRVIQIDAPSLVASFLQRLGRTGRRAGTKRNCLFAATTEDHFLRAAGLLELWGRGQVEPVAPPPLPAHVLAQQLLALSLQEGQIGKHLWREWLPQFAGHAGIDDATVDSIVGHLLAASYLVEQDGLLAVGPRTERELGRRHYMELCSVFTAEPLFTVLHGREDLGRVHPISFVTRDDIPAILLLGGRSWRVRSVDWSRQQAQVEPAESAGRSRWLGVGQPDSYVHCQAIRRVLAGAGVPGTLTQRAEQALSDIRSQFSWVNEDSNFVVRDADGETRWWTFGGLAANAQLATTLGGIAASRKRPTNLFIELAQGTTAEDLRRALDARAAGETGVAAHDDSRTTGFKLKFADCLPPEVLARVTRERTQDESAVRAVVSESIETVVEATPS